MPKNLVIRALTLAAVLAAGHLPSTASAALTYSFIDVGAPKVPVSLDPSGNLTGYTGYLLRLDAGTERITAYDFGVANIGAVYGDFVQRWTSSTNSAISAGSGYDLSSAGPLLNKNAATSVLNADTHFLGDNSTNVLNVFVENASFFSAANNNPLRFLNSDLAGYGVGNSIRSTAGISLAFQTSVVDVAYFVVPTGSPIFFTGAQVATNLNTYTISSPGTGHYGTWNGNAGSWNNAANWTGGIPNNPGDTATVTNTITLDGNKTIAHLTSNAATTINPGTGGTLIFDNGVGNSLISRGNSQNLRINAPIQLNSNLEIIFSRFSGASFEFAAPVSSGPGAPTSLSLVEKGTLTLSANNSYAGPTFIGQYSSLVVGNGGTTGTLGTGDVYLSGNADGPASIVFNRSDTYTVNNFIHGTGNLIQKGPGTLVLSTNNDFFGTTTILAGTIIYSGDVGGVSIAPNADFTNNSPAVVRLVPGGAAFSTVTAASNGGFLTQAHFRAGIASSPLNIAFSFRTRKAGESSVVVSDVARVTGMTFAATTQTDVFAMELSYADNLFPNTAAETAAALAGTLDLGWLNPTGGPGGTPEWQNAVNGNFGAGTTVIPNFQGSWAAFAALNSITDANVGAFLGSWGVDTSGNTVWAVINHNSDFASTVSAASPIPEPASLALLTPLLLLARRRRAHTN